VRAGFVEVGGFAEGDGALAVAEVLAVLASIASRIHGARPMAIMAVFA
jgi:hypothetical protein